MGDGEPRRWWYGQSGQPYGPLGSDEIRSLVERGVLDAGSWIVPEGSTEWSEIRDHAAQLGVPPFDGEMPSDPAGVVGHNGAVSEVVTLPLASGASRLGSGLLDVLLQSLTLYVGWIIWSIKIWPRGLTPAKQLLGLRVVDLQTGEVATRQKMVEREVFAKFVLQYASVGIVTVVSVFMVFFNDSHQAVWDRVTKTVVVDMAAADESPERRQAMRSLRTGWGLLGLSLLAFVAAGFTGEGGGQQGAAWAMVAIAAVLAAAGLTMCIRGYGQRRVTKD